MRVTPTAIAEVLLIEPKVFADARGFFFESYNERAFTQATGVAAKFVQDNHSRSVKNTVRGLHYQIEQAQGKLRVVRARFRRGRGHRHPRPPSECNGLYLSARQ
jgi:dTDP-4-dehydrorhamnose 3,5-epimerase